MSRIRLPLGFKFQPTDTDLVSGYLLPKSRGENLPADFIRSSDDVYEKPPSEFCTDSTALFGYDNVAKHYFFTELNRFNQRAARTVRSYGSWHESKRKEIKNNNNKIIGFKKWLNFKLKSEGVGKDMKTTEWLMHEFSLGLNEGERTNLVLCVIQNKKDEKKGSGSRLLLGLGLDSGSGTGRRLKIASVESFVDSVDSGSPRSIFDNLDLFEGIYTNHQFRGEIGEAERGIGGLHHHLADATFTQSDEETTEVQTWMGLPSDQLADDADPQFDPSFPLDSTITANENPRPAQDEETQQSKKMRPDTQFGDDPVSGCHLPVLYEDIPIYSPDVIYETLVSGWF